MVAETSEMEFDLLIMRARHCDMFVGRHKDFNPAHSRGDLYLSHKARAGVREPAILIYATEDQVHAALGEWEKEFFAKAGSTSPA